MAAVTQAQVAKAVGLSRSAVEKALNPRTAHKLPEKTRQKIMDAVQRLGYRPHRSAQVLRSGRSGTIGIIYSAGTYQAAASRAFYCVNAVRKAGFHPLAVDATFFENDTAAAATAMIDSRVEGVVVLGPLPGSSDEWKRLKKAGIPVTMVSNERLPGVPQVYADNRRAFFDLTRHVIQLGHRNLVFLLSELKYGAEHLVSSINERALGAREAILKSGGEILADPHQKPSDPSRITGRFIRFEDRGWFDLSGPTRDALRDFLAAGHRPDAILCGNDYGAFGAVSACLESGLRVPKDVAVTGFDNISLGECLPGAPLTTVAQPSQEMVELAVQWLLAIINGEKVNARQPVKIPCRLVIRESCGAAISGTGKKPNKAGPKNIDSFSGTCHYLVHTPDQSESSGV